MADSDEEYYEVPIKDQRYFGAGIKRRRVHFVPSSTASLPTSPGDFSANAKPKASASERYLSVVFNKSQSEPLPPSSRSPSASSETKVASLSRANKDEEADTHDLSTAEICEICKTPINSSNPSNHHTSSLVHQICLPHTHPPSALDRKRKGIGILQAYGWDPDARTGLGAAGEGILHPVKAKQKRDTLGLGVGTEDDEEPRLKPRKKIERPKEIKKVDAGQIRKMDAEQKIKDKRLREMFYANDEVEKYLGGG